MNLPSKYQAKITHQAIRAESDCYLWVKLKFNSELSRNKFVARLRDLKGIVKTAIEFLLPESKNLRGFYHGGVLVLYAYLNELDYKDSSVIKFLHEEFKKEFNGEMVFLEGKPRLIGKSTKGVLKAHTEQVIGYLEDNYGIERDKVLNADGYKKFRDEIFINGEYDTYVDYLKELNRLP